MKKHKIEVLRKGCACYVSDLRTMWAAASNLRHQQRQRTGRDRRYRDKARGKLEQSACEYRGVSQNAICRLPA